MREPLGTIDQLANALRGGSLTSRELVQRCLDRIDRLDPAIRAWVAVDRDGAIEAAEQSDRQLRAGTDRGRLHGIPIGIKDIFDVCGVPTRAASTVTDPAARREDAPLVAALRGAGAIILGKTVTTQFACFDPSPTRNPLNAQCTPGGSSSGSAAAVAAGMVPVAMGSQTGGSIVRPATYCGICGFKPSWGRLDMTGIIPVSGRLDHAGPLARCVGDLQIVWQALRPPSERESAVDSPPRIGWVKPFFMDESDEQVRAAVGDTVEICRTAAAAVVDVALPVDMATLLRMHWTIMAVDAAANHGQTYPSRRDEYAPKLRSLLDEGRSTSVGDYQKALDYQAEAKRAIKGLWNDVDLLLTPATPAAAPRSLETTGDPRFNSPWSYLGLPTVSIARRQKSAEMPVAMQLTAADNDDDRLLEWAKWLERAVGE